MESLFSWMDLVYLGASIILILLGIRGRVELQRRQGWRSKALRFPEQNWNYDVEDFRALVSAAPAGVLRYYVRNVLRVADIGFAIGLAAATVTICRAIAASECLWPGTCTYWPWLTWLAEFCCTMGALYGIADIAEDLKLASILGHAGGIDAAKPMQDAAVNQQNDLEPAVLKLARGIDPAEATAVNMLTRIKMATLGLSLVGAAIFFLGVRPLQALWEKAAERNDIDDPDQNGTPSHLIGA
jgi:hypothetical protein